MEQAALRHVLVIAAALGAVACANDEIVGGAPAPATEPAAEVPAADEPAADDTDDAIAPAGAPLPETEALEPADEESFDDGDDDLGELGPVAALGAVPPQTVFVNFGGPVVRSCAGCSDARRNRSLVINQYLHRSSVDFAAFTDGARRTGIVAHLRSFFSRYAVRFTTKRPPAGEFTMLVISPSWAPNHGIAPLDCRNTNRSDIAFVFRTGSYSAKFIAQEAAHELGHSFGLAHVKSGGDIMQWASSGDAFTRATYDTAHPSGKCFQGSVQNGPALLAASLDLRPNN